MKEFSQNPNHSSPEIARGAKKNYIVPMFPYPSGKLHMGHARNYVIADAFARRARAKGEPTLFPIGWDSFGLPAEKAAQERGVDPKAWTEANIEAMRSQLKELDLSFDWSHELATHKPSYYQHTQRLFIELMKAGWVERRDGEIWWDPVDQTALANEQVIEGRGWRSGAIAIKKNMPMYWIKTSRMAQQLGEAAGELNWSHGAKADHQAWIGWSPERGQARLRDWCVSRSRSWGTPMPCVECDECGAVPVNQEELPWGHERMGTSCDCPRCGKPARASSETLDTFFDSAWYFLRYPMEGEPGADRTPFGEASLRWNPVDLYVGGREHATMHLLYARFMARALASMGWGNPKEPFERYMAQGMVKARAFSRVNEKGIKEWVEPSEAIAQKDGSWVDERGRALIDEGVQKMSKSKRNGVEPSEVIQRHGIDAARLFLLFAAPFEMDVEWSDKEIAGCARFVDRIRAIAQKIGSQSREEKGSASENESLIEDQRAFMRMMDQEFERGKGLNRAVALLMDQSRKIDQSKASAKVKAEAFAKLCAALAPLAPRLAEQAGRMVDAKWSPSMEPEDLAPSQSAWASVAVQWEGKTIGVVRMSKSSDAKEAFETAQASCEAFKSKVTQSEASAEDAIWVPGRVINGRAPRGRSPKRAP